MLDFKFDKNAKYLVSSSFGPDSMALIDMLQREGVKPIVVVVNYHADEHGDSNPYAPLEEYCKSKGLTYEYLDTHLLPEEKKRKKGEDFKTWARKTRYEFFRQMYDKHEASALFVAHIQDDVLESYLLEKRGLEKAGRYGLGKINEVEGMIVARPLIRWTHDDLVEYVKERGVPCSEGSEVFEIEHLRNDIRKNVINNLNEVEREQLIAEMEAKKSDEIRLASELALSVDNGDELDIRALLALPRDEFYSVLVRFVSKEAPAIRLNSAMAAEIRAFVLSEEPNGAFKLAEGVYLIKEYDVLLIGDQFENLPYTYVLEKPSKLKTDQFELDFSMGAEDRHIVAEDYPLTIRTALPSDVAIIHGYSTGVLTAFSIWKMPSNLRHVWPVFVNKDGKIVYVPRYARNFQEYHSSLLKIKVK